MQSKRFVVVGLGKTGFALAKFLYQQGAKVLVSDHSPLEQLKPRVKELMSLGIEIEAGGHKEETFLRADGIVLSPGVNPHLPVLKLAKAKGIPVWGELDIVFPYLPCPVIAITGTNGKTTTTTLLGKLLKAAGKRVWVGGNIGTPLVEALKEKDLDFIVAEVSSFQLEINTSFHPFVAICLNVAEDHLDRHGSLEVYRQCKLKIAQKQRKNDWFIFDGDDPALSEAALLLKSEKLPFGIKKDYVPGAYLEKGKIIITLKERWEIPIEVLKLKGTHNYKNVMAALLAAQITGCELAQIEQTLKQFPGLPHRLEWVRSLNGVSFYNDSKATNISATLAALESLEPPIVLIAGGLGKGQDFTSLGPALQQRTKAVVLLGKDAPKIAAISKQYVPTFIVSDLRAAVRKAWELARPKGQVLLSPACASFDMFKGYQERGEYFKEEVYAL